MITYFDFLNEGETKSDLEPKIRRALRNFLSGENIRGFSSDITGIILGDPSPEVIIDVIDLFQKEGIKIEKSDVMGMSPDVILSKYLEKNGMTEYLNSILYISGEERKKWDDEKSPDKAGDFYYLNPKEGEKTVWSWDNDEMEGTPRIIWSSELNLD